MQKTDTLEAVLFDFDGTIADTLEEVRLVVNQLADVYDFKSVAADEVDSLRQLTLPKILKELGISKLLLPILLAKGTKALKGRINEVDIIDGMKDIVNLVRSRAKTVGILTSNSVENVELFLERNQLTDCFDFIKSSSKISSKASSLRKILKKSGITTANTIYIGDEVRDIEACKKVGLPIISVTWGFNAREVLAEHDPEYIVETAEELVAIIEKALK